MQANFKGVPMKYEVIVIGGGPAGLSAAMALQTKYPQKKILLIREEEKGMVPCGMPYIFGLLKYNVDADVKPHAPFMKAGGTFIADTVTEINREAQFIITQNNETISYDKLVIATGSEPMIPTFIKGYDNPNIYYIKKSYSYMSELAPVLKAAKRIAVIGGGFIGLETADELASDSSKEVTVIEMQEHVLSLAFSKPFSMQAEVALAERGVNVRTNTSLQAVSQEGDDTVLTFNDESTLAVDVVIFALGYKPQVSLAKKAGLGLNRFGAIVVDNFMRTEDENIVAIGDCAKKRDFFTRKESNAMLASVAGAESRYVAENLFEISSVKNSLGTIRVFGTVLHEVAFGVAGINAKEASLENMDIVLGTFVGIDKHPAKIPGAKKVEVHLTVLRKTGTIIGGEISGGVSVGEMTNVLSMAIQSQLTIYDFYTYQMGTQPLLTAGPTVIPLMKAAEHIIRQLS